MVWILLSALFVLSACTALILNWQLPDIRNHIIGGIVFRDNGYAKHLLCQ